MSSGGSTGSPGTSRLTIHQGVIKRNSIVLDRFVFVRECNKCLCLIIFWESFLTVCPATMREYNRNTCRFLSLSVPVQPRCRHSFWNASWRGRTNLLCYNFGKKVHHAPQHTVHNLDSSRESRWVPRILCRYTRAEALLVRLIAEQVAVVGCQKKKKTRHRIGRAMIWWKFSQYNERLNLLSCALLLRIARLLAVWDESAASFAFFAFR